VRPLHLAVKRVPQPYLTSIGAKDAKIGKKEEVANPSSIRAAAIVFKYTAADGVIIDSKMQRLMGSSKAIYGT